MILKEYRLLDGSIYWHNLYYDIVPDWMTRYSPPGGRFNYAAYLYQPTRYIAHLRSSVKYFIQRGVRGYSDQDVWNWCGHHSRMMVGVLQYLRAHAHGYPSSLTSSEWSKKLVIMEQGFQAAIDEENDHTSYKKLSKKEYRKLILYRQRKLMLGLKYFRTYYYNLWD